MNDNPARTTFLRTIASGLSRSMLGYGDPEVVGDHFRFPVPLAGAGGSIDLPWTGSTAGALWRTDPNLADRSQDGRFGFLWLGYGWQLPPYDDATGSWEANVNNAILTYSDGKSKTRHLYVVPGAFSASRTFTTAGLETEGGAITNPVLRTFPAPILVDVGQANGRVTHTSPATAPALTAVLHMKGYYLPEDLRAAIANTAAAMTSESVARKAARDVLDSTTRLLTP